jgi:hypothetical protein
MAIENQELADIKEMEEKHGEFEANKFRRRLEAMLDVHTAEEFGVDVPDEAYGKMARALKEEEEWSDLETTDWFAEARELAERESFFHWRLEYPEAFYEIVNGEGDDFEAREKETPGFDAVIGNPPYVNITNIPDSHADYFRNRDAYTTSFRRFDLYVLFSELADSLSREGAFYAYIIPDKSLTESYASKWRKLILSNRALLSILDLRHENVFEDATNSPIVFIAQRGANSENISIKDYSPDGVTTRLKVLTDEFAALPDHQIRIDWTSKTRAVLDSIEQDSFSLSRVFYASWGTQPGNSSRFVFEEYPDEIDGEIKELIKGSDINRYNIEYAGRYLWYDEDELHRPAFPELFESDKICMRKVAGERGLIASIDKNQYYTEDSVVNIIRKSDLVTADDDTLSARGITIAEKERPEDEGNSSKVYDRDTTLYEDDLRMSESIKLEPILGILNSSLIHYYYSKAISGQLNVFPEHARNIPLLHRPEAYDEIENKVIELQEVTEQKEALNLSLLDYLGISTGDDVNGDTLGDLYMPPAGLANTPLTDTTEDYDGLRVKGVKFEEDGDNLVMSVDISYKPGKKDPRETDHNGYLVEDEFETYEAMVFTGLTDEKETLIRNFVPVDIPDGKFEFRKEAAATISLKERLEALTLPDVDATRDGLERYMEVKERADKLDEKIEKTDALIDEIVYDLYGLTDEEIEIVEEAVEDS